MFLYELTSLEDLSKREQELLEINHKDKSLTV